MDAVRVTRWLKNPVDGVALGEPLVEVETEKSVVEIEATAGGRLVEILVQVGEEANVGDQIARIETAGQAEATTAAATTSGAGPAPTIAADPAATRATSG